MSAGLIQERLVTTGPARPGAAPRQIHAPQALRALLARERARTDQTGHDFTVVVFPSASRAAGQPITPRLVAALLRRARTADELGWTEDGSLCAFLPDTSRGGARAFAAAVCELASGDGDPRPVYRLYTYPFQSVFDDAGKTQGFRRGRDARASRRRAPHAAHAVSAAAAAPPRDARDPLPAVRVAFRPMPRWKRAMDVVGAGVGLVLAAPLMLGVAAVVRLTSRGDVLFRQTRAGLGGVPFVIYKFRTMVHDADARKGDLMKHNERDGPAFKMRDDPRVTRVGRVLRRTSLDELPQLWNVLKGEMSLVGPRPLPYEESAACDRRQRRRLVATPGITCIWQVKARSAVSFEEWLRMDLDYIRRRSPLEDLKILLLTIPAVLFKRGS